MTAGWHDEDAPRGDVTGFGHLPGRVTPIAPDAARDARVDTYRDRERRRAARQLDRYIETRGEYGSDGDRGAAVAAAGDRFVEAVGDYVLARLGQTSVGGALPNVPANGPPFCVCDHPAYITGTCPVHDRE
jgi:hypothetical protein